MKKTISLLLVLAMCAGMCACGHVHAFGEWSVATDATCTAAGVRVRTCECGKEEKEEIPAGHAYGEAVEIKAVTCTEAGTTESSCKLCGEVKTEEVAATGHDFEPASLFAPKTCKGCGLTEGEALAKVVKVGEKVESEDHDFTIESAKFSKSLKYKKGRVTYTHSSDYALALKLSFTNKATEAFERWSSDRTADIALEYQGKYRYEGEIWVPADDIVPLSTAVLYVVFEVPKSMGSDNKSAIYASFTIDGVAYTLIVQEGEKAVAGEEAEAKDVSGDVALGETRTNDASFSFKVADLDYTNKPSYKSGNVTYTYSSNGYSLVCRLDFTNLSDEALSRFNTDRITDVKLTFADKYTYEGDLWIPNGDIVPLSDGIVFLVFDVAKEVETSTDPLTMTFTVDGNVFNLNCR